MTIKKLNNLDFSAVEQLLAIIPGHVYWKDCNGLYRGCNDAQAKSLGLTRGKEVIGKTDFELPWDQEDAKKFRENDLKVIHQKTPTIVEENATVDGKPAIVISHKIPLFDNREKVIGILGISLDITTQKENEKLIKENQIAEEKFQIMQLFAATIAHELRTPFAGIGATANGIKHHLSDLVDGYNKAKNANLPVNFIPNFQLEALSSGLETIAEEIQFANTIVDMILIKAKYMQNLELENLDICSINTCIHEAIRRYPMVQAERDIIHLDTPQDFHFKGKELFTIHILFNLIKNALYYIKAARKGDIRIKTEIGDTFNTLYFTDTGKGISSDILPHIFDRFFTNTYHGTGVGLAFCKMVMQAYGGEISCDSIEGQYTKFTLRFKPIS